MDNIGKGKETNPICSMKKIRSFMNYRIYINTLKQTYDAIRESQENAQFEQIDRGEYIEVIVKIPKS